MEGYSSIKAAVDETVKNVTMYGRLVENTLELCNLTFSIGTTKNETINKFFDEADKKEYQEMEELFWVCIEELRKNLFSRKAAIAHPFPEMIKLRCPSLYHLIFRDGMLNLNVYMRSVDVKKRFKNDLLFFNSLLTRAAKELKVKQGRIVVFLASAHIYKEDADERDFRKN
jgi:thymidylate synthase